MSPAETDQLLVDLLDLSEEEQRQTLRSRSELDRSAAERLLTEAGAQIAVDLQRAGRLAGTALWLAQELDDDYLRGRSQRMVANVSHFRGEHQAAAELYDEALESFSRAEDEKEEAITRSSALHNLIYFGEYRRAFEWAETAREIFERLDDRLRLARLELNLANIFFRQDKWEEAAKRYENAYHEFCRIGEPSDVAKSLRNMAVCHSSLNNFMQALELYERARAYSERHNLTVLVAEIDYNIAYLYYLRGEYTTAIELYQQTRKRCQEIGERYHMALCDLDQSEIFLELNLIEGAAELAQRAFNSMEELGVPYETAKALTFLAIAVSRSGKAFLAIELLHRAREIFVREENQTWQSLIDLYEAVVLYRAGRPLEAARLARSALREFSASLPKKAAMCEVLLARVHLENGDRRAARLCCNAALARLNDMDTPALPHQVYFVLGQIEEACGDLDRARAAYRQSQGYLEHLRSHLQVDELKIGFLRDKLSVYESLVSLTLCGDEATISDKEFVFACFERAKSRSLADLMSFRAHALPPTTGARSEQAEQIRKLREELNWYYRQIDLQEMREDDLRREDLTQLREASHRQEDHLVRTLRELQSTDQEFSFLQEAATADLESIRANIPEDTLLVEYYRARGILYGCVLGSDVLEIVPVTVASRAQEIHRLLQFQLSKFRLGSDYVAEFSESIMAATETHLHNLYQELIAPLRELLRKPNLVVIPHDFLHYIPFHALYDGERFLMDRFTISYAPSASVHYLSCIKRTEPGEGALVLGVPDGRTHYLEEEVQAVADVFAASRLLVGEEASEDSLRRHGENTSVIYLATHAFHRRDNPMFSSIQLGTSELYLFDIYNLRLNAELVVLSGCGTGLGLVEDRDELVGMTRGLLYAGARSALATLWDVKDDSTGLFMRSFFSHLKEGSTKPQALREAMAEVRTTHPHPYHWAPYVLVGNREAPGGSWPKLC